MVTGASKVIEASICENDHCSRPKNKILISVVGPGSVLPIKHKSCPQKAE
jgi:hypothetical protein